MSSPAQPTWTPPASDGWKPPAGDLAPSTDPADQGPGLARMARNLSAPHATASDYLSMAGHILASPIVGILKAPGEIYDWVKRGFRNAGPTGAFASEEPITQAYGDALMAVAPDAESAGAVVKGTAKGVANSLDFKTLGGAWAAGRIGEMAGLPPGVGEAAVVIPRVAKNVGKAIKAELPQYVPQGPAAPVGFGVAAGDTMAPAAKWSPPAEDLAASPAYQPPPGGALPGQFPARPPAPSPPVSQSPATPVTSSPSAIEEAAARLQQEFPQTQQPAGPFKVEPWHVAEMTQKQFLKLAEEDPQGAARIQSIADNLNRQAVQNAPGRPSPTQPPTNGTPYLYHGTSSKAGAGVAQAGGITPSNAGSTIHFADNPETQAGVYLSESPESAATFANSAAARDGGEPVILQIDRSKIGSLRPDPEAPSGRIHDGIVPTDAIAGTFDPRIPGDWNAIRSTGAKPAQSPPIAAPPQPTVPDLGGSLPDWMSTEAGNMNQRQLNVQEIINRNAMAKGDRIGPAIAKVLHDQGVTSEALGKIQPGPAANAQLGSIMDDLKSKGTIDPKETTPNLSIPRIQFYLRQIESQPPTAAPNGNPL